MCLRPRGGPVPVTRHHGRPMCRSWAVQEVVGTCGAASVGPSDLDASQGCQCPPRRDVWGRLARSDYRRVTLGTAGRNHDLHQLEISEPRQHLPPIPRAVAVLREPGVPALTERPLARRDGLRPLLADRLAPDAGRRRHTGEHRAGRGRRGADRVGRDRRARRSGAGTELRGVTRQLRLPRTPYAAPPPRRAHPAPGSVTANTRCRTVARVSWSPVRHQNDVARNTSPTFARDGPPAERAPYATTARHDATRANTGPDSARDPQVTGATETL